MIGRRTVAGQGADRPEPRAGVGGGFAWWVGWEARGWVDPMGGGGAGVECLSAELQGCAVAGPGRHRCSASGDVAGLWAPSLSGH